MKNTAAILAPGVLVLLGLALLLGEPAGYVAAMLLSFLALMVGAMFHERRQSVLKNLRLNHGDTEITEAIAA